MAKARKEIDKDSMYQKIMPSAMRSVKPAEGTEVSPAAAPAKKAAPRTTTRKAPAKAAPTPVITPAPAPAPVPAPIPAPAPYRTAQPPADTKPNIVNIMELLIDDKIELAIEKFHCCTCDRCRQDITAMALNKLHPKYIVAEPDSISDAMSDKESNTQVTTALVQAILKVKANPKH